MNKNLLYRKIPKVDLLLEDENIKELIEKNGYRLVVEELRNELDRLRGLVASEDESLLDEEISNIVNRVTKSVKNVNTPRLKKVINATGTILHTNLGRAPISKEQAKKLLDVVCGYSNLEYNLEEGKRGERYSHFEELIRKLTGAEAALVVNNNAAAVMLILSTIAKGGEAIVSRGELVEIGGKFRIPDVMAASGVRLVEVGTTNKTHFSDYEDAITEDTKAFLKVHTSNYNIVGFTKSVKAAELKELSLKKGIPIIEDLGSGVLVNLEKFGLSHEPTVMESIEAGVDIVCFSGDKLLGGPQAGIIIGKKEYIDKMKKNPLTRALRIDKFTVATLELVLMEYLNEEKISEKIPVLKMIGEDFKSVEKRAGELLSLLKERLKNADCSLKKCQSQLGGGSMPLEEIDSMAVVIRPKKRSVARVEEEMRLLTPAIIGRILDDSILLDVRTVASEDFEKIATLLGGIF